MSPFATISSSFQLVGGDPRKHHSWKSDLYLKNKKSNKPQMFCNKPLVLTCSNMCVVSLLTSVEAVGTPGLAATSPAPVPAGNVTLEQDRGPQQALLLCLLLQLAGGCSSPGCWRAWGMPFPGDAIPRCHSQEVPFPGWGWPPRWEHLGCGRGARRRSRGK